MEYVLNLTQDITSSDIRRKFKAFETLFGPSKITLKGEEVNTLWFGKILPAFGVESEVVNIGNKFLLVDDVDGEETAVFIPAHDPLSRNVKARLVFTPKNEVL